MALSFAGAALGGALIGSFLNVVIARLPAQVDYALGQVSPGTTTCSADDSPPAGIVWPASHCQTCKHPIRFRDNIPVLSWVLLRGRCRDCGTAIARRYPMVEVLTALLTVTVVAIHGLTPLTGGLLLMTWWLVALAFIDLDTQLLPDVLTLTGLWAGLLFSLWNPLVTPYVAIVAAAAGYAVLWTINAGYHQLRGHDGLGYGDFKLFAMIGAWGGVDALITTSLIAPVAALLVVLVQMPWKGLHARLELPFGPYLALGGWVAVVATPSIIP